MDVGGIGAVVVGAVTDTGDTVGCDHLDDGGTGVFVVEAVTDPGDAVGGFDCFIGVSG